MKIQHVEIKGLRDPKGNQLWLNGKAILPKKSLSVRDHSLDGFEWGYLGSGPSQTALAICLELFDKDLALRVYQEFKFRFVAAWHEDSFTVCVPVEAFLLSLNLL